MVSPNATVAAVLGVFVASSAASTLLCFRSIPLVSFLGKGAEGEDRDEELDKEDAACTGPPAAQLALEADIQNSVGVGAAP
jgi:hypothetical protein